MKQSMDTVTFEARWEVKDVATALDTYLQEHPQSEESEAVGRLQELLEVMDMAW